jgi:hypothetical protein
VATKAPEVLNTIGNWLRPRRRPLATHILGAVKVGSFNQCRGFIFVGQIHEEVFVPFWVELEELLVDFLNGAVQDDSVTTRCDLDLPFGNVQAIPFRSFGVCDCLCSYVRS